MPELPEVETVRRGLAPVLEGRILVRVEQRRANLRLPFPNDFAARLRGRRVIEVGRRAKYLLFRLDSGEVVIVHLGMSGSFRIFHRDPPAPGPHDHVVIETDRKVILHFHDPRRFGLMTLTRADDLETHSMLAGLGPEPLEKGFDEAFLAERLRGRRSPIKTVLMDQKIIAGLGNIYASEILFRAGISPRRKADSIRGVRARRLAWAVRDVLGEAIIAGGSSLRDHRAPNGELGYFQHRFAVYGRPGEPCPNCDCDPARTGGIRRMVQSGRSTFYCARRQR